MSGSDYDGQDQAYVDLERQLVVAVDYADELMVRNDRLKAHVTRQRNELDNIAHLIHYQSHLKHQDRWLARMIEEGLVTIEGEEEE
tara:strand:- start:922 stop:1179 length:258 start_codon:yes stop_codon:yes gene_type:complete